MMKNELESRVHMTMPDHDLARSFGKETLRAVLADGKLTYSFRRDCCRVHPGIFKKTLALPPRYGTRFVQGPIEQLARRAPIARGKHPSNAHESSHAHRRRQSLSLVAHPHDRLAVHSRSVTPIHASHGKCYYRAMSARAFILSALLLIPLYAQQTPREFEVISVKPRPVGPYEGVMHFFDG